MLEEFWVLYVSESFSTSREINDIEKQVEFYILAGGRSRRMGGIDKGLIQFDNYPLIEHVIRRIREVFPHQVLAIVTDHPQHYSYLQSHYSLNLYPDVLKGVGSLGGLFSAFSYCKEKFTVVLACDMPFIDAKLLQEGIKILIKTQADAFVPSYQGKLQPFHAVYQTQACKTAVKKSLESGNRKSCSWLENINIIVKEIAEKDAGEEHPFYNINTPQDLMRIMKLCN